jgi:hypothetical protein
MALIKNLDEQGAAVEDKKVKTKSGKKVKPAGKQQGNGKGGFWIFAIIIIVIVGAAFAFNYKKMNDLQNGDQSKTLNATIEDLKTEIQTLNDRAQELEKAAAESQDVVVDLFDKSRKLPTAVDAKDWFVYNNDKLSFSLKLPTTWEVVKTVDNTVELKTETPATVSAKVTTTNKTAAVAPAPAPQVQQTVYLQPKDDNKFILAMTFRNDYLNFSNYTLTQKADLFKDIKKIDSKDFAMGKMIYYIDIDKENHEIPTILVLTDKAIYRATFNILDKKLENYMKYRVDFENIVSTFGAVQKVATPATTAPSSYTNQ